MITSSLNCFSISVFCDKGFFFNDDGTSCVACAVGSYKDMRGNYTCMACELGKTTEDVATDSVAGCSKCKSPNIYKCM